MEDSFEKAVYSRRSAITMWSGGPGNLLEHLKRNNNQKLWIEKNNSEKALTLVDLAKKLWESSEMQTVNMHEAKTHLSRLVERVQNGEHLIIGKAGKPVAVLSPYKGENIVRRPGSMKGKIRIGKEFDAEDGTIEQLFTGDSSR